MRRFRERTAPLVCPATCPRLALCGLANSTPQRKARAAAAPAVLSRELSAPGCYVRHSCATIHGGPGVRHVRTPHSRPAPPGSCCRGVRGTAGREPFIPLPFLAKGRLLCQSRGVGFPRSDAHRAAPRIAGPMLVVSPPNLRVSAPTLVRPAWQLMRSAEADYPSSPARKRDRRDHSARA